MRKAETMKPTGIAILVVAGGLILTGCAAAQQPPADPDTRPAISAQYRNYMAHLAKAKLDVTPLRNQHFDYPPEPSPEALAAKRPIVAAGVVDGWQQGPATASYPGGPLEYRVVLRVRITDPLKGAKNSPTLPGGVVFIEFDQGPVIRDDTKPAEEWLPEKSVADFEAAIPTGTKTLVFPRTRPSYEQAIVKEGKPLPDGATLMSIPPQGLIFEDPKLAAQRSPEFTSLIGGMEPLEDGGQAWLEPKTMDELVARLRAKGVTE